MGLLQAGDGGYPVNNVWQEVCLDPNGWEAVRYHYVNWRYIDGGGGQHAFPSVHTVEADVCDGAIPNSSGYSADGWWMGVTGYYYATVLNASGQQVYP